MAARVTDSLDSKLSPRAYPATAPRPAKMATGGRSAFQKVNTEPASQSQLEFYDTSFSSYGNRNNNNSDSSYTPDNRQRTSKSNNESRELADPNWETK